MTESQIKAAVMAAWRNREFIKRQNDRSTDKQTLKYRGLDPVSGYTLIMWLDAETCQVTAAYPDEEDLR